MNPLELLLTVSGISWWLFSWGLSGGIASFFSPCALPMLPAYLSYYVAAETTERDDDRPTRTASDGGRTSVGSLRRGAMFGGFASMGMLSVFVLLGIAVGVLGDFLQSVVTQFIPLVGLAVIGIGVAMLTNRAGWFSRSVQLPEWKEPSARHFATFGILFAGAALGCTAPIFVGITLTALSTGGVASAVTVFTGYASGMIGLFVVMTALVALAKEETSRQLRSLIPYVEKTSAVLLMGAGAYMLYYYWQVTTL